MRSRKLVTWGVSAIAVVAGLIAGCSKKTSAPTNPITNPEYNYMVAHVNETLDSLVTLSDLGLDMTVASNVEVLNDLAFGPMPIDSVSVVDLWHIYLLTNSGSGVSNTWIDSVQFSLDGVGQLNPLGANELQYVRNWSSIADDTTLSYKNVNVRSALDAANTSTPAATISGQIDMSVVDVDKSGADPVVREFTLNAVVSSLTVDQANGWSGGCPTSGDITITANLSVTTGGAAPVVSTWTFDVTFSDGKATVTVTQNALSFSYASRVCSL